MPAWPPLEPACPRDIPVLELLPPRDLFKLELLPLRDWLRSIPEEVRDRLEVSLSWLFDLELRCRLRSVEEPLELCRS